MMIKLTSHFPALSNDQIQKFLSLRDLIREHNQRVNLISRKDMENIEVHHILHSLSIAKIFPFEPRQHILDLGTGGGFPGLPLAIYFSGISFTLIDGTKKKIKAVEEIIRTLELKNVKAKAIRAEDEEEKYDQVVTRAVATMDKLIKWGKPLLKKNGRIIALKGGMVHEEMLEAGIKRYEKEELYPLLGEPWFRDKYAIRVQL